MKVFMPLSIKNMKNGVAQRCIWLGIQIFRNLSSYLRTTPGVSPQDAIEDSDLFGTTDSKE